MYYFLAALKFYIKIKSSRIGKINAENITDFEMCDFYKKTELKKFNENSCMQCGRNSAKKIKWDDDVCCECFVSIWGNE